MFPFLSSHGVLGLNARNLLYIKPFNPRKAVAFADDKLKTKAFLSARGIPVAKVYAKITSRRELRAFDFSVLPDACVLKPNFGFGGEGILVFQGREGGAFLEQGKRRVTERELRAHIEDILDGSFSVNGRSDTAFFEEILTPDPCFARYRPAGLPDIRIIVFNLVPVMAMLRIPTVESRGKANVHLGGLGIGIDLSKGTTTHAAQYDHIIETLPHGGGPAGFAIPRWEELLLLASRIQYVTNIGYLAADLTLDIAHGPVLLEVNARAGLMVQVANLAPLRSRLERVAGITIGSPEKGVRLAQDLFGEARRKTGGGEERPVLAPREVISFSGEGIAIEAPALLSLRDDRTSVAPDLLAELLRGGLAGEENVTERTYRVRFTLGPRKLITVVRAAPMPMPSIRAIVGRRDLQGFLIDPGRVSSAMLVRMKVSDDLRAVDRVLADADETLSLLPFLKPVNLAAERASAERDSGYEPVFQYRSLPDDLPELEARLKGLTPENSPLGTLLREKRDELLTRIVLLRARGKSNEFTEASRALFGDATPSILADARAQLATRAACELLPTPVDLLSTDAVAPLLEEALARYGLHGWRVDVRANLASDCAVGGKIVALREGAVFSRAHVDALVAHEIETHVLTSENALAQPVQILRRGTAKALPAQEGLAIFSQNRVISPHHEKRFGPARSVLAVAYAATHGFAQTRSYLERELGYSPAKALTKAIDCKRGLARTAEPGGLSKGIVYLLGLRAIETFAGGGGNLACLYIGKVGIGDLPLVAQIPGIEEPLLLPFWLREERRER